MESLSRGRNRGSRKGLHLAKNYAHKVKRNNQTFSRDRAVSSFSRKDSLRDTFAMRLRLVMGNSHDHRISIKMTAHHVPPTWKQPVRLARFGLSFLLVFGLNSQTSGTQASSQHGPCDPTLHEREQDPQGYRLRGDRCEGIYLQTVSGSSLLVASFTSFFEAYDPGSLDKLSLEWSSPAQTPVRLRAYALREKLYYQMDAVVAPDKATYSWQGGVLNALHLSKPDIGVVGFIDYPIAGENRTVYLPLRIHEKTLKPTHSYELVLVPGSQLKEVFISLAKVEADGRPHTFSISDRPLHRGYYPAERGTLVEIPNPGSPGIYFLEVGATTMYGEPLTQQIWFYHDGVE